MDEMEKDPPKNYKRICGMTGRSLGFFFNEYNSPWFTIGPDWPFFLCTWFVIALMSITINTFLAADKPLMQSIGNVIIFVTLGSYGLTALVNPGIEVKPLHLEEDP